MDLFTEQNISPMLLSETLPFDDPDFIFELKLDGIRCLAYLDKGKTLLKNKRNKDVTALYPELRNLHCQVKKRCILDGELVLLRQGAPDFYGLQARSVLGDRFKIEWNAARNPVNFSAFDILYCGDKDLTDLPLFKRKEILQANVTESERLSYARYIEQYGKRFYALTAKQGLEGVVAKYKYSRYKIGERAKDWLKIKTYQEEDLVICGYTLQEGKIKDLVFGAFDGEKWVHRGNVYFGVKNAEQQILLRARKGKQLFATDKEVVWLAPTLIGTVKYMQKTKNNGMRQPVFKGIRTDSSCQTPSR